MAKMAKRRRSTELQRDAEPPKKRRKEVHLPRQPEKAGHHVLSLYFPTLLTLRQYLVARLSSLRRSQAQDRGLVELQSDRIHGSHPLCSLLDTTLVGLDGEVPKDRSSCYSHSIRPKDILLPNEYPHWGL
ncbi:hypothetical protein BGX38DRAFT_482779 [Terfezia claveryi]|nr:hypothetical protein BGX38DRAFT_482779 [Terfezia claveryi]